MVADFSLIGTDGDVISLGRASDYVLTTGLRGTGLVASDLRITKSATDGATWRSTRKGVREFDLPVTVFGSSHSDVETKLRRLAKVLSDRAGQPVLRATEDSGDAWDIPVHYVAGAETTHGEDGNNAFCTWAMTLQAPDPYWTSTESVQFSVAASTETRGLLAAPVGQTATLSALRVSSSQAIGSLSLENPGDIPSQPVWIIDGPADTVTITQNGIGFEYAASIAEGERVTIDTRNATVLDATGTNLYGSLAAAPKMFSIPAGVSTVSIVATGADTATRISGYFNPRREVLY